MKILLTAVNSKYIHSNPAVYELKSYYEKETQKKAEQVWIAEYTINQPLDEIIGGIYEKRPDVVALSCYLWNIEYVQKLIPELLGYLSQHEAKPRSSVQMIAPRLD